MRQEIEAVNASFMALYCAGNRLGAARLYAEDAQVLLPNAAPLSGRDAAPTFLEGQRGAGIGHVALVTMEAEFAAGPEGPTARERGGYRLGLADGTVGRSRQVHRDLEAPGARLAALSGHLQFGPAGADTFPP